MLKPGGQIVVVDYRKEKLPVGPPPRDEDGAGRSRSGDGIKRLQVGAGTQYQYFLVFTAR